MASMTKIHSIISIRRKSNYIYSMLICCESLPRTILLQFMEQKVENHFSFSGKLHAAAYERETECHSVANYLDGYQKQFAI